jgi:hypothetical protein
MTALAFDTHKAVKALKEAGFGDAQAEAVVGTVGDAVGGNVATKADIADLRTEIAELKADMLKVAIGIVVANAGLTLAIVKLL